MKRGYHFFLLCITLWSWPQLTHAQRLLLTNEIDTIVYNCRTCLAESVIWHCDTSQFGNADRHKIGTFKEDVRVPEPRAHHQDYTRSGYDRGHLAPAADFSRSLELMRSTFLLSNVAPMTPRLNRGPWKRTEDETRRLARKYGRVRVRVYSFIESSDTARLRRSSVAIPTSFAKIVSELGSDSILAEWYLPNK